MKSKFLYQHPRPTYSGPNLSFQAHFVNEPFALATLNFSKACTPYTFLLLHLCSYCSCYLGCPLWGMGFSMKGILSISRISSNATSPRGLSGLLQLHVLYLYFLCLGANVKFELYLLMYSSCLPY